MGRPAEPRWPRCFTCDLPYVPDHVGFDPRAKLCRDCRYELEVDIQERVRDRMHTVPRQARHWAELEIPLGRARLRPADWRDW